MIRTNSRSLSVRRRTVRERGTVSRLTVAITTLRQSVLLSPLLIRHSSVNFSRYSYTTARQCIKGSSVFIQIFGSQVFRSMEETSRLWPTISLVGIMTERDILPFQTPESTMLPIGPAQLKALKTFVPSLATYGVAAGSLVVFIASEWKGKDLLQFVPIYNRSDISYVTVTASQDITRAGFV